MDRYKYVGASRDGLHYGMVALGTTSRHGIFRVQVTEFEHKWSHGWHTQDKQDWELIK